MEKDKQTLKVGEGVAVVRHGWPGIMVDLETLGISDKASILEIGARCFDLATGEVGPGFHVKVALASNVMEGREIDAKTLNWWMDQWRQRGEVPDLERGRVELGQALIDFEAWWKAHECADTVFWSRGSFDERILRHALSDFRFSEDLWKFWQVDDQRTVLRWEGVKPGKADHDALGDATLQVEDLLLALRVRQQGMSPLPGEPDLAAGWEAYRTHLLETHGCVFVPAWHGMSGDQREAFACGVRACFSSEEGEAREQPGTGEGGQECPPSLGRAEAVWEWAERNRNGAIPPGGFVPIAAPYHGVGITTGGILDRMAELRPVLLKEFRCGCGALSRMFSDGTAQVGCSHVAQREGPLRVMERAMVEHGAAERGGEG